MPMVRGALILIGIALPGFAWQAELTGWVSAENISFTEDAPFPEQTRNYPSLALQPELYYAWDGGDQSLLFSPFFRYDPGDDERTHGDIRELFWQKAADRWELRAGIRKVFWGVTESQHLVDIINQTDLVENLDSEDKLGQPMINFAWIEDWGTLDFFLLTGFRERTFPGEEGRLRGPFVVDTDRPLYESSGEEERIDWAIRYEHVFGPFDIGISHFSGTSREPLLTPDPETGKLIPFYPLIDQTGLDAQATLGGWLLKWEIIFRQGFGDEDYLALVGGFEYTLVNLGAAGMDLGLLAEYHYDERDENATSLFEDDLFVGSRLAFNEAQSTEILAGAALDLDGDGTFINLEAERRLGDRWKLALEFRTFTGTNPGDFINLFRDDDHARVEITRFF